MIARPNSQNSHNNGLQNQKQQLTESAIQLTLKLTTGGFLCKTPSLASSRKLTSNGGAHRRLRDRTSFANQSITHKRRSHFSKIMRKFKLNNADLAFIAICLIAAIYLTLVQPLFVSVFSCASLVFFGLWQITESSAFRLKNLTI